MSQTLTRIGDVLMRCKLCKQTARFDDCLADVDGEGSPGCPQPDCGGMMETPLELFRVGEKR